MANNCGKESNKQRSKKQQVNEEENNDDLPKSPSEFLAEDEDIVEMNQSNANDDACKSAVEIMEDLMRKEKDNEVRIKYLSMKSENLTESIANIQKNNKTLLGNCKLEEAKVSNTEELLEEELQREKPCIECMYFSYQERNNNPRGRSWNNKNFQGRTWGNNNPQERTWNNNNPRGRAWNNNNPWGRAWNNNSPRGRVWESNNFRGRRWSNYDNSGKRPWGNNFWRQEEWNFRGRGRGNHRFENAY